MPLTLSVVLVCSVLALAPDDVVARLALDRQALLAGEVWRLWTGHLVHFSVQHAALDTMVLWLVGRITERELGSRAAGIALMVGAPLIALGVLLATPDLMFYRGASGIAALLGVTAGVLLWRRVPRMRGVLGVLGAVLVAKTLFDTADISSEVSSLPLGVSVAWQAHVIGGVIGVLAALLGEPRIAPIRIPTT